MINIDYMCLYSSGSEKDCSVKNLEELRENKYSILYKDHLWNCMFSNNSAEEIEQPDDEVLCFAIANILCFIQQNFTGPQISDTLKLYIQQKIDAMHVQKEKILTTEAGVEVNTNVVNMELLYLAKHILSHYKFNPIIQLWWKLRIFYLEQCILDDTSESIFKAFEETAEDLLKCSKNVLNNRLLAQINLEIVQNYLLYGFVSKAKSRLQSAYELLDIQHDLVGELGKRTKYQQKEVAQLLLNVQLKNDSEQITTKFENINIVVLDDEVRLNDINYTNDVKSFQKDIPNTEQLSLLAHLCLTLKERPQNELEAEELKPYITFLLNQTNNSYCVRLTSLFMRCKLEDKHRRTIERTLSQCEALIVSLRSTDSDQDAWLRVCSFWGSFCKPIYETETLLATVMMNLGLVKASLEIFQRLQYWEDVIVCFTILEQRHRAAEVIKDCIKQKGATVKMLCLLGDATDDESCYEQAWQLSKERSAKAQRHWGLFLFAHKKYEEAIEHLKLSVQINSLQVHVWSRLGFAALTIEDWQTAAWAYRRFTDLEQESFEAWNNLAKAYIKLGDKARAHRTLNDALKCNFDNWKVWDNFMAVSAALGFVNDAVRAYNRILDLKDGKHIDLEVLEALVHTAQDTSGLQKLFGRITSVSLQEGHVWELYAMIAPSEGVRWQRLQRAYRAFSSIDRDWPKDPKKCENMLKLCSQLSKCYDNNNSSEITSTKLILRTVVSAVKKYDWDLVKDSLKDLECTLESISVK